MRFEGRIAIGLDEFMLRLGHIKLLLTPLKTTNGNRARIARDLAQTLTRFVDVPLEAVTDLGNYLVHKKLSKVRRPDGFIVTAHPKARYSDVTVVVGQNAEVLSIDQSSTGKDLRVWYEDLKLSDRRISSRVGAVTADTREISNKSGVSHLVDWSVILGVANRRLSLTAAGRTIEIVCAEATSAGISSENPYIIGPEKLALARTLFAADGDFLARLFLELESVPSLSKTDAMGLGVELSGRMIIEASRSGGSVSNSTKRLLRDLQSDMSGSSGRLARKAKPSSSAWHRMSSRLESLVDLGFLDKTDTTGSSRSFDYYYRPTDTLRRASQGLKDAESPSAWADGELSGMFELVDTSESDTSGCEGEIADALALCLGPTGVHIDSYSVVAASLALMRRKLLQIADARSQLTQLAIEEPDLIRLSRGYVGSRAEFASLSSRNLGQIRDRLLAK